MTEMSEEQRVAAAEQGRELRESGAYLALTVAGGVLCFWLIGAAVINILVLPYMATLEAMTCP